MTSRAALDLQGLTIGYSRPNGDIKTAVWDVSLTLEPGKILGLAGESGCGKSTTALAAIGYRSGATRVLAGKAIVDDTDLLKLPVERLRQFWGRRVVYVPQAASTALTPAMTVGAQLAEPLAHHMKLSGKALRLRQLELFEQVGIPKPEAALKRYPHQFSGGQQQRIALAIALSCDPAVLVLDEPTTGLDVTTQARISKLLTEIVARFDTAALYVSHDLTLLSEVSDRIAVMYGGQIIEEASAAKIVADPKHPYTQALMAAVPDAARPHALAGIPGSPPAGVLMQSCPFAARCSHVADACVSANPPLLEPDAGHFARCVLAAGVPAKAPVERPLMIGKVKTGKPILSASDVWCQYTSHAGSVNVVKGVTFDVAPGETLGIVGESGSGKSTLLKAIAGLHPASSGTIAFEGGILPAQARRRTRQVRRDMQIVFQNPDTSLNPRQSILQLVARPLQLFQPDATVADRTKRVREMLDAVKLPPGLANRYPSDLSGGQRQRVAIARAFISNPRLLLCDEVTSALDVSVQATILELIAELSANFGTSVVFVSHDLGVVRTIAHRALVLEQGEVREIAEVATLFANPTHPYTKELIGAIPTFAALTTRPGQAPWSTGSAV